eukprot:scaffold31410_cov72-Skeletonema_dohrnii-CCMP3373.AAC.4
MKYLPAWSVIALCIPAAPAAAFTSVIRRSIYYDDHKLKDLTIIYAAADAAAEINDHNNNFPPANLHQRNIVVLCQNVSQDVADGIFDVNNLLKGRIDVLARCITSALWVSNRVRTDTNLFLMLSPHNITIEVQGSCVKSLTPDERTSALYLQRTLWSCGEDKNNIQRKGGQELSSKMSAGSGPDSSFAKNRAQSSRSTYINPKSAPMSEEKRLRDMRKGRDAMIHRIRISHQGKSSLPGFILHQDDTLQNRLNKLESLSSGDGNGIWMLSETGDPLWEVLEDQQQKQSNFATKISTGQNKTTTTLIVGNQLTMRNSYLDHLQCG